MNSKLEFLSKIAVTSLIPLGFLSVSCGDAGKSNSVQFGVIAPKNKFKDRNSIPVCFVNGQKYPALTQFVRSSVADEFSGTILRFSGWQNCKAEDISKGHIRIQFADSAFDCGGKSGDWSGCSYVGTSTRSLPGSSEASMLLRILNPDDFSTWPGWDRYSFKRTIVHEFGHAIGLYHEHERMDAVDCESIPTNAKDFVGELDGNALYTGTYDKNSIMNYCSSGNSLSEEDRKAINLLYWGRDCDDFAPVMAAIFAGTSESGGFDADVKWSRDHCIAHGQGNRDRVRRAVDTSLEEMRRSDCGTVGLWYENITKAFGIYNVLDQKWAEGHCANGKFDRIVQDVHLKMWYYWD